MTLIIVLILLAGCLLIATSHITKVNKAALAVFVGTLGWVLYICYGTDFVMSQHPHEYMEYLGVGSTRVLRLNISSAKICLSTTLVRRPPLCYSCLPQCQLSKYLTIMGALTLSESGFVLATAKGCCGASLWQHSLFQPIWITLRPLL